MQYDYPLDLTGIAASNLVANEPQVITEINGKFSQIIIPDYAPFYLDNLKLEHVAPDGSVSKLDIDVDFFVAYPYQDFARETGKMAFGAIIVTNKNAINRFKLTYQTIGDKWAADPSYIKQVLLEKAYNPRIAYFDQLTNVQDKFPPVDHTHDLTESDRWPALIAAIDRVTSAIANRDYNESSIYPTVVTYLDTLLPQLLTKDAVGLGNVVNLDLSSDEDIALKNQVDKYITLKQVLTLLDTVVGENLSNELNSIKEAIITLWQAVGSIGDTLLVHESDIQELLIAKETTDTELVSLNSRTQSLEQKTQELEQVIGSTQSKVLYPSPFSYFLSQS